jgi:hypothetical protein
MAAMKLFNGASLLADQTHYVCCFLIRNYDIICVTTLEGITRKCCRFSQFVMPLYDGKCSAVLTLSGGQLRTST